ncbi:flagellar hook assembly protein FlgD [Ferrovibrio sp.]|uniref:flagellar hook assembly protein FlgD n=1 Tax=Ferrovibrio sp. TaxID=1917215 RepID=UPI0035ADE35C
MVTSVTNNTATTATSAAGTAGVSLAKNFDTFLKLLTTQLKNQDPTSPMDSKEFTQQLVQFSQVEQQINQNKNLEKLISMIGAQTANANLGYIGKDVVVNGGGGTLAQDGKIDWMYNLPAGVTTAKANVYDEAGKLVYSTNLTPKAGRADFSWDGTRSDGVIPKPGNYKMEVVAKDGNGKALTDAKVYTTGRVDSLEYDSGDQYLVVGNVKVLPADIVAVRAAQQ